MKLKSFVNRFKKPKPDSVASESQELSSQDVMIPQLQSESPPINSSSAIQRNEPHGLFLLKEYTPSSSIQEPIEVDIVAIHGLNGDAFSTWEHENGVLWLRDMLPSTLPGARIFSYGYPAGLFFNKSVAGLRDYSQRLLRSLADNFEEGEKRPIIFVCHSLGGIVCKQAIVLAHEDSRHYAEVLSAISGIVFLGTPHRGAQGTADIGKAVGAVINAILGVPHIRGVTGSTRVDLLNTLSANSESLKDLATSFRNRLDALDIVTFYETETTPPLSYLVVDKSSAIMDIPGEDIIPLYANHVSMCRFGQKSQDYKAVSNAIKRLARNALRNRALAKRVKHNSSDRSLNEAEKSCMVLLNSADPAEYKADLPRPVQGTCRWILNHPQYISWITQEQSALLWITGEPGCGKTILSAYLTDHLTLSRTQLQPDVFFFFCNDQITTQNDAKAIIRSILHQILRKHRSLIKHLKSRYETDGSSIIHSFPALWETFLKVVRDSKSGPIGVIIDAIDECEESTRRIFLNHVKQLVYESGGLNNSGQQTYIKFLITSQPYLGNLFNSSEFILSHLPIEKDGRRISEDVRLVIKSKVGEIAKTFQLSNETKAYLEEVLDSKADRTFLWVELILRSLEETSDASKKEFERIINTFPDDLQETYKRFLRRIPLKNLERAKTVLHILIGSARHLNLAEINIAFTIDQSHKTVAEVRSDYQPSMGQTLQRNAGAFIRVNNSKVSLIHQSAKEFLTNLALHSEDPLVNSYGINSANAALGITRRCVRYLLLDDFMIDLFALRRTNSETSSPSSFIFDDEDVKLLNSQFDGLGLENDHIFKDEHAWDEETYSLIAEKYEFFDYAATHWGEHFSQCEIIASVQVRDSVLRLIDGGNCALKNWLKYYWIKTSMEYPFPESFENVMVASFFNLSMLLDQLLQSKEYDESAKNQALFWAGRMNCPNSVKVLLQHGGNPNCQVFEHTPLTVAAKHGNLNVVRLLLAETRTDHAFRAKHGRSALSLAAGNGHWEVVNTILNQGRCPANDQDRAGSTPLFWAVGGDYDRVVRRLLETFVVNLNHLDKFGRSATSWAAGDGSLKALRILVKHKKVNVNLSDSTGRSPLSWAAGNGQTEAVGILMRSKKLEKSSTDMDGRSAISWACQGAHVNTLKTLLKYECPGVDDEDVSGWTPLAWALNHNSPATVETLISARTVEIDRQDKSGRTALSWSASYGYLEVVQLLISHGAKVKIVDHGGRKAAHWATINGHTEVAEMLETKAERD